MRKKTRILIYILVPIIFILLIYISSPFFIKKYIISKASDKGLNLQIQNINISMNNITLFGVKASKKDMTTEFRLVHLKLKKFKPTVISVFDGKVNINSKNTEQSSQEKMKWDIYAHNISITYNGIIAQNVSLERTNDRINSVYASEVHGSYFGYEINTKRLNFSKGKLQMEELTLNHVKLPIEVSKITQSKKQTIIELLNKYGIQIIEINAIDANTNGLSISASNVLAQNIKDNTISFKSATISGESLESPIEIQNGNLKIMLHDFGSQDCQNNDSCWTNFTLSIGKLSSKNMALSHNELDTKTMNVMGMFKTDNSTKRVLTSISSGSVRAEIDLYKNQNSWQIEAMLAETQCDDLVSTFPSGMVEKISSFKFGGKISAKLSIDTAPPKPKVKISLKNGCRVVKAPASMDVSNFKHVFTRTVPGIDGKLTEIESGPGSRWWIPLNAIAKCMPKAVMTTEDAGFERHNGFIIAAIENSIIADIESGKFTRGGSTVSMQLSKNLWLSRVKTLSRKLQEFFLTTYLEQSMTKNEIMELYLNMVELGPGIYGVEQAANEYFDKSATSLTLGECLYLSSILPAPRQSHFTEEGVMHKQWAGYLQTLMKLMASKEYISEDELNIGLAEQVQKGGSEIKSEPHIQTAAEGISPSSWK